MLRPCYEQICQIACREQDFHENRLQVFTPWIASLKTCTYESLDTRKSQQFFEPQMFVLANTSLGEVKAMRTKENKENGPETGAIFFLTTDSRL
jgi:hypothetical protein